MEIREGGKYKRRDGVVSNRVLSCLNGKVELLVVWEDGKEGIYYPNGKIYNPFNRSNLLNELDVVGELSVEKTLVEAIKQNGPILVPQETLFRWLQRVKRCDAGGYPTNVALEIEVLLGTTKSSDKPDDSVVNHEEAKQLASFKKGQSNLARCYLELLNKRSKELEDNGLITALRFYANEDNYYGKYNGTNQKLPDITEDMGETAKKALELVGNPVEIEVVKLWHEWKKLSDNAEKTLSHQDGMEAQLAWNKLDDLMESLKEVV